MDQSGSQPCTNPKHEVYCMARMTGMTPAASFTHAGYKGKNHGNVEYKSAVKLRLYWLRSRTADRAIESAAVTRVEIVESVRETRTMAKKGTAILDRATGQPTGEFKADLASANRADEILAKMHGFMLDVTREETLDEELDGKDPKELEAYVLSLLEQLDPNMRKILIDKIGPAVIDMDEIPDGETLQ